ncbi:MAG: zinc carboxypeptidase [Saprospiraceae bacterium]|nr:zinc carboxypeptidase [Saprospiraceae bacterium]
MKNWLFIALLLSVITESFSQALMSPDEYLPHAVGDKFTPHHLVVDYFNYVAEHSSRVQVMEYGRTNEERPLTLAFVSTPENLARLEEIRENNLRRAGLVPGEPVQDGIAIVWLSFSVHGNEAAGSESSMPVLYALAHPGGNADEWLRHTVVILDPSINPDGYSRYTEWNRRSAANQMNTDIQSWEHREPWPGGRTNHYLFDLNRDWAWQTQVESQQRIKQYNRWLPQIHADFHEMGYTSPYYFAPAAQPYHNLITPFQRQFQDVIGRNHARHFAEHGWLFFTKEVFDLLYPSYGDTYPIFHGAIGMTYEEGGGGTGSRGVLLPTGDTLTLRDRVAHHTTTALSTVEISAQNADKLTQEFTSYFESRNQPPSRFKGYLIKGNQPDKVNRLTSLLDKNNIQYGWVEQTQKVRAFRFQDTSMVNISMDQGDLVISAYQPFTNFLSILFEPNPHLVDSVTYDITSWCIPYAYGVETYGLLERTPVTTNAGSPASGMSPLGDQLAYGYLLPWTSMTSAQGLAALQQHDVQARVATVDFRLEGKDYPAGTVMILRADNRRLGVHLLEYLKDAQDRTGIELIPVAGGYSDAGPDLGSGRMDLVNLAKVAVLGDEGTSSNSFGQVWYYFEQVLHYPMSVIRVDALARTDLSKYNTLILPEGFYDLKGKDQLKSWVRGGGRIIAVGSGIRALNGDSDLEINTKSKDDSGEQSDVAYGERFRDAISEDLPGAIFRVPLDKTHPLSFGLTNPYFSLKTGTTVYEPIKDGWNPGKLGDDLFYTGFVGHRLLPILKGSLVFGEKSMGRGKVVYLVDNPLFRGFWDQGNLLFANALYF